MFCPNCGKEIQEGGLSCPECGSDLAQAAGKLIGGQTPPPMPVPPPGVTYPGMPGPAPQKKGMPVIAIVFIVLGVGGFFLAVLGILAAIAIPSYLRFNAKAKQSEAKTNLHAIFVSEVAYYSENNGYGQSFEEVDWFPEGDNKYAYFLGQDEIQPAVGGPFELPEGIVPYISEQGFLVVAVGNIDSDDTLDIWTMDDQKTLICVVDDTRE